MSATEWKFVPVNLTDEMGEIIARRGRMCGGGAFELWSELISAAPVPPSVESLLENWTPSDRQAFSSFINKRFPGEMSSHAIQSLGSAWKDGQANAQSQPSAHLTIPGALEWDGDNGTHGVVGTHGADSESRTDGESKTVPSGNYVQPVPGHCDRITWRGSYYHLPLQHAEADQLRARLADRDVVLNQAYMALIGYLPGHRNDLTDAAIAACSALLFPVEAKAACSRCGGWGHIETKDSAHDCPECGPSVIERAVEAGVMNAPPKPRICIECDQPYCHGVCVERGDQDYDRDQAAKGGDQ